MDSIAVSFHNSERLVKQNNERWRRYAPDTMSEARKILAANLLSIIDRNPDLDSRAKISKKAKVALGVVSNMASKDMAKSSPTLKAIEGVARACGLKAWEILHPNMGDARLDDYSIDALRVARMVDRLPPDSETRAVLVAQAVDNSRIPSGYRNPEGEGR